VSAAETFAAQRLDTARRDWERELAALREEHRRALEAQAAAAAAAAAAAETAAGERLAAELAAAAGRQSADQNTLQQQAQAKLTQLQEQHAAALQVGCNVGWLTGIYSH
jgi:hypothetical protein